MCIRGQTEQELLCGFCFTEQGDGSCQVLSLAAHRVQVHEALHQGAIATPAISNLTRLADTPDPEVLGADVKVQELKLRDQLIQTTSRGYSVTAWKEDMKTGSF